MWRNLLHPQESTESSENKLLLSPESVNKLPVISIYLASLLLRLLDLEEILLHLLRGTKSLYCLNIFMDVIQVY